MFAGYAVAHLRHGTIFTNTGLIVVLTIFGAATVGFLDDWIKVTNARNLGLSKRMKDQSAPMLDAGLSALLDDLDQRGLLSETLVVAVGEFGRSPQRGVSTSGNDNNDATPPSSQKGTPTSGDSGRPLDPIGWPQAAQ